ncbi:hypothetical protein [Desulfoluna spongiiphila]|uniref:hypothetical protein n=1 Tax=Desulfoluna spongiiphila TaxID=419481 RepID=UPI0012571CC1|nr:hypothetical protein [Desulfoluna spongiiphila]VVS91263.1 hypothetical protein DBB_8310 [Desulfoluna spongiiphila]
MDETMCLKNKVLKLKFDKKLHDIRALRNAAYDLSNEMSCHLSDIDDRYYGAEIVCCDINKDIEIKYLNSVNDHQIRVDLCLEFNSIREMIVAQAFEPCDNMKEIVGVLLNDAANEI